MQNIVKAAAKHRNLILFAERYIRENPLPTINYVLDFVLDDVVIER